MKKPNENKKKESQKKAKYPDIWEVLKARKEKGLWHGEIKVHKIREFNLSKGDHYYVVEDIRKRSVKCISCPVTHGGLLEANLLARYKVENGIIYLDGNPTNTMPKSFKSTS